MLSYFAKNCLFEKCRQTTRTLNTQFEQARFNTVFLTGTKYALIGNVNKGYGLNND